jgi:hypothetical protein
MKITVVVLAATAVLVAVAGGAYAYGQSTRMSDRAVTAKVNRAVKDANSKAGERQEDAVRTAVARTQLDMSQDQNRALKNEYERGVDEGRSSGDDEGYDTASQTADDAGPRSTVTTSDGTWDRDSAAYRARCRDLYNAWKSSEDPATGNYDGSGDEAIQEHARMLCDQ